MKHLSRYLLASLFVLCFGIIQAQDKNNPWAIEVGVNAVDLYPVGEDAPRGDWFSQYFNVADHWNIIGGVTRLAVSRYIGDGFVFEAAGSINQISDFGDMPVDDLSYYSADGAVKYSLRALLNQGWFDPNVGLGGGYTWVDDTGAGTLNGTVGFNFWFSDNVALNLQSTYKHAFNADNIDKHFQHVAGIKFVFGGKDTDGDGIYDKEDECPETPGLPEFNGCPDSDGDGIEDRKDECPNTAGLAQFNGCPDSDGDGIPDPKDECPQKAGKAEFNGCPDSDGDGVADPKDKCPEVAGPVANNGCPWPDRDGDGIPDKDDKCPDVAGTSANEGCPEVTAVVIAELNEYSKTILFDLNKASIRPESTDALNSISEIMKSYPNTVFHIEGHTDSQGSDAYNLKLSKERAQSVKDYLVERGIPASRLTSEGYGESRPIASNATAAGRQLNRRVEISLDTTKTVKEGMN